MEEQKDRLGLRKLLEDQVAGMYYAEQELVKVLDRLCSKAVNSELRAALTSHREETKRHAERLEQVFTILDEPAKARKCAAIDGIIGEGSLILKEFGAGPALDAGLIAVVQKTEHYKIATYSFLCECTSRLGQTRVEELLRKNLEEEKAADQRLTSIIASVVKREAVPV